MLVDYHMHLRSPRDDVEEIDHTAEAAKRFAERARERGVDEIGFTEHVYYFRETRALWSLPYQLDRCVHALERYVDAVLEARRCGLPVKLGLEVDWVPRRAEELAGILAPYPWDFLLVSVHWLDGLSVDSWPGIWDVFPPDEIWRRYFRELEAAARSGLFDSLAHPDLVKIFGVRPADGLVAELHESAADAIAASGAAAEVSSAGLRKRVGELYPDASLLAALRRRGVPITTASDAHLPQYVGEGLERVVEHARGAGYETVTVFDRRRARQERLG